MTEAPKLTDRPALTRARRRLAEDALFLHDEAIASLQDRLSLVNRTFTDIAIVTGAPGPWAAAFPGATIVPDDEVLALEPGAHDLVLHGLALHWANDPVGQLIQSRRALRGDGLFLGVMFGGQSLNELRTALAEAESRLTGGLSPRVLPMADIRDLGALLQRAGLALPVADADRFTVEYGDILRLMRDLRGMGEVNVLASRLRKTPQRDLFPLAGRIYAETFGTAEGRLPATVELITLSGWAPDPSQPKPLRPGSAAQRLADALGTEEKKL
ncbi:SAM-dependent methyltransferase [Mesobacterium pallidum]|uniref:SAM-dependent methyltransferase n=1 Tax=Mesobacterium pallidum TaxID=2872037 RepID=UPI001EE26A9F|nr:SAM-dependent methyltransferase [Mesobacterium pallidum]